jgi:hypothetical protein
VVELSGSLAGVDLVPMLRLLSDIRQTGTLQLTRGGWSARLDLHDGRVVSAAFADAHGLDALSALGLVMHDAEFIYSEGPPPPVQELDLTPDSLSGYLESAAGLGALSLDLVPCPTGDALALPADGEVVLHHSTVRRLLSIDGRRTVGELVGLRPSSVVLLDLAHLVELGLIRLESRSWVAADDDPTLSLPHPAAVSTLERVSGRVRAPRACPQLGFADEPGSHYDRPTAVHRCYVSGSREAVSILEQRQYCLNGEFESCPRLRPMLQAPAAARSAGTTRPPVAAQAPSLLPPAAERPQWHDRILPSLAIALTALALLAVFLAFVWPRLTPTAPAAARPTDVPTLAPVPAPAATLVAVPIPVAALLATVVPTASARTAPSSPEPAAPTVQLLDARFSTPQSGWPEAPPFAIWASGAYRLSARQPGDFVAVAAPLAASLGDVIVQATLRKVGGPPGGGYGVIVRDQQPDQRDGVGQSGQFYVLAVGDRGEFGVWRREGDRWVDVKTWTPSPLVHPGSAPNELTVRVVGDRLTFLINGAEATTEVDDTLFTGAVGLFVGGDGNEVAVERFTVTAPAARL